MAKRVRIGVTGPDRGGFTAWTFTKFALFLSEAEAVRITPSHPVDPASLDGLIVGGGSDIDPALYGARRHKRTVHIDRRRDKMEWQLLERLYPKNIPILGICRGMQMLNVFLGGTLNQHVFDLDLKFAHTRSALPHKMVTIKPHTLLHRILGVRRCEVNALHHQSVRKPGKGLIVNAYDENRIVQGIEHAKHPFYLGVQWHPEYMPQSALQRRLFTALVERARAGT